MSDTLGGLWMLFCFSTLAHRFFWANGLRPRLRVILGTWFYSKCPLSISVSFIIIYLTKALSFNRLFSSSSSELLNRVLTRQTEETYCKWCNKITAMVKYVCFICQINTEKSKTRKQTRSCVWLSILIIHTSWEGREEKTAGMKGFSWHP